MSNVVQRSFTGGEISPELYARTDQVKYATGLRTLRNFLVQRHGGAANRPGTGYVAETKDSAAIRPFKFVFNDAQTYLLEFGDRYMRVVQNGGQLVAVGAPAWVTLTVYALGVLVTRGGITYYCTAAHTSGATTQPGVGASWASNWYALTNSPDGAIYEIPTPYLAADLATLQIEQSADVITIVHPNYAQRELRRTGHTAWTLVPIAFAPSIGGVTNVAVVGGAAGPVTYWAITAIDGATGEEGLPVFFSAAGHVPATATPTTLSWDPVAGAIGYNVYRSSDGQTYGLVGPAGGTQQPASDTTWVTNASAVVTSTVGAWVAAGNQARNAVTILAADKAYDGSYTVKGKITVSAAGGTPDGTQGRVRAFYSRDGEPRIDAGLIADGIDLFGAGSSTRGFSGTLFVPDNGYAALQLDFVAEVLGYDPTGLATFTCSIDTSTAPDNVVSWVKTGTGVLDTGIAVDYLQSPPTQQTLFQSPGSYPGAVALYQQRRLFANSANDPERVWGSRTGAFASFTTSTPLQDDDAVSFTLASRQVNAVQHMLDAAGRLFLLTASSVVVVGESDQDVLTPTNINARQRLAIGSSTLPPIVIGNVVLFVEARGSIVRDLRADVVQGYKSDDLTLFAAHLVDGYTIASWDFARTPHSILWMVRSDGVLLGLTYLREQEVWGWHRHDTDGAIENVCVVPEAGEDRVYWVVRRVINGVTKRYIERMHVRTITALTDPRDLAFVDCGLSYDGRNTGATTMILTGGVLWDQGEQLTCTASAPTFVAGDVGNAVPFYDDAGTEICRVVIEVYVSPTIVTVRANKVLPLLSRGFPTTAWARAVDVLTGLDHLEGKAVSVIADGVVAASPNNAAYTPIVVAGGQITLDQPGAVVHVGLPYISDLETLDIDTPQGPSLKAAKMLVQRAKVLLKSSRGGFVGRAIPTGSDPLEKLDELKIRDGSDAFNPIALRTGQVEADIPSQWNSNGRIAIRQVDPAPLTILGVIPQGIIPPPQ